MGLTSVTLTGPCPASGADVNVLVSTPRSILLVLDFQGTPMGAIARFAAAESHRQGPGADCLSYRYVCGFGAMGASRTSS